MSNNLTYWQSRCIINENMLDALVTVVGNALPHTRYELDALLYKWQEELNKIGDIPDESTRNNTIEIKTTETTIV